MDADVAAKSVLTEGESPKLNLGDNPAAADTCADNGQVECDQPNLPELDPADPSIAPFLHSAHMKPLADGELKLHDVGRSYHDMPAEVGLLCALLAEPERVIDKIADDLSTEVFYDGLNSGIVEAVIDLLTAGKPVDRAGIITHLQTVDPDEHYATHLDLLYRCAYNPKHVPSYMRRLKRAERIRGGESYAHYKFNEPFCALLFRLRMGAVKCVAGVWHRYNAGVWKETSRHELRPAAMRSIHPRHRESKRFTQVLDYVESACQVPASTLCGAYKRLGERILINADNGVLDVAADGTVALAPHCPGHNFTLKIPTPYLPSATCPLFKRVIRQALPDPRDRLLLRAFAGYLLLPSCELETALICFGSGGSGKSTTWEAIKSVLGSTLCGAASLEQLCQASGYSLPTIRNKMLNLGAEASSKEMEESTNFKLLVSGESMLTRQIYCAPEDFSSLCKLVFLSNHMPFFRAGSDAEERRLRILPFNQKPAKKDPTLKKRLAREASGVLNWMLQGLTFVLRKGAIPAGGSTARQALNTFRQSNNPVDSFVAERCRLDPQESVKKDTLREGFYEWCEDNGQNGPKMGDYFFRTLRQRYGVQPSKPTINGKRVPHLSGLTLVDPPDEQSAALRSRILEEVGRARQARQAE